jgi:group I intron endonuclease
MGPFGGLAPPNHVLKRCKSPIHGAILKHKLSKFKLEILEYCGASPPSEAIGREQFYINSLEPEYNILKTAGSRLGSNHSE